MGMSSEQIVRILAGTHNKDGITLIMCEVVSVSESDRTIVVKPIQGESESHIEEVKISAEDGDGFILFPSVGSSVLVSLSDRGFAYVLMYSDVDSILMRDKTFGGLVKVEELRDSLKSIKEYCEDLKSAVSSGLTAVGVGSSANGGTGATNFETQMAGKTIEIKDMENPKILHG